MSGPMEPVPRSLWSEGMTMPTNDPQVTAAHSPVAEMFGRRNAARLFEGRKGHGGGPCSYRSLRPAELAALLAAAFEAGARHAKSGSAAP